MSKERNRFYSVHITYTLQLNPCLFCMMITCNWELCSMHYAHACNICRFIVYIITHPANTTDWHSPSGTCLLTFHKTQPKNLSTEGSTLQKQTFDDFSICVCTEISPFLLLLCLFSFSHLISSQTVVEAEPRMFCAFGGRPGGLHALAFTWGGRKQFKENCKDTFHKHICNTTISYHIVNSSKK